MIFSRLVAVLTTIVLLSPTSSTPARAAAKKPRAKPAAKSINKQEAEEKALALNNRAVDLMMENKLPAAEKLLKTALTVAPKYPDTYCNLGSVLWEQDKAKEAEKILRAGLKLQSSNFIRSLIHYNLGKVLADTKRLEEAAAEFRMAMKFNGADADSRSELLQVLTERGLILDNLQRWHDSEVVWREILSIEPKNAKVQFLLAGALIQQSKNKEAEAFLKKVIAASPTLDDHRFSLVTALVQQDKENEAIAHLRQLITRRYKEPFTRRTLAQILMLQNKSQEAENELRLALKSDPRDAESYIALAECLLELKRPEDARKVIQEARQLGLKSRELDEMEKKLTVPLSPPIIE